MTLFEMEVDIWFWPKSLVLKMYLTKKKKKKKKWKKKWKKKVDDNRRQMFQEAFPQTTIKYFKTTGVDSI